MLVRPSNSWDVSALVSVEVPVATGLVVDMTSVKVTRLLFWANDDNLTPIFASKGRNKSIVVL